MKNLTSIAMLLFLAVAMTTSCQKETIENDFQINAALDKEIFDNILVMSNDDIEVWAKKKHKVLIRIKATNPGIKLEVIYPSFINPPSANRGESCESQYSGAITNCRILLVGNIFASVVIGVGVGVVATPVGGGATGIALIGKDALNYKACTTAAIGVRDNCVKNIK